MVLLGLLVAVVLGAVVLGGIARGVGARGDLQSAADLSALAGARAMHDAYPRVFEPPVIGGVANPRHLERADYLALGEQAARATAARNGARDVRVAFPGGGLAPIRVRVTVHDAIAVGDGAGVPNAATAEAELAPPGSDPATGALGAGEYRGPFAYRQGKPMRPDVALAFDRMAKAARADGVALLITSAFRTDAEQARLFAAHPDPKWVAPPGRSLHRLGTELDLGPPAAYGWLAANAERFHFVQRYAWEAWHFGYALNAGLVLAGLPEPGRRRVRRGRCRPSCPRASRRRSHARRSAGACRARCWRRSSTRSRTSTRSRARPPARWAIAQFMPATAARLRPRRPVRRRARDRRPGPPDARPAARVRLGPARAGRLQRRPGAASAPAAASRRSPRPSPTSPTSSACCTARATRRATAPARWRCGWCAERHLAPGTEASPSGCMARQTEEISPSSVRRDP